MENKKWVDRFALVTDLQDTCIPGMPLIEIAGTCRVLIEHHCGVKEYGKEKIVVSTKNSLVSVEGENLELVKMTSEQLVISGSIRSVSFGRR